MPKHLDGIRFLKSANNPNRDGDRGREVCMCGWVARGAQQYNTAVRWP